MPKNNTSRRRRSAAEWSKLIASWRRSGQTAEQFAAANGLRRTTLEWWRWHLARRQKQRRRTKLPVSKPRLVAVEIQPEPSGGEACPAHGWELEDPRGFVLRVHGPFAPEELRQVLTAFATESSSA